ncbi:unnamed protein product [Arctia plantaginis]|uniref:STING ligand-binding domain-containing protein n=1 Tax=Arctia plantaginis TaxID=874455 RepID=A0A8S1B4N5_ARCPL|nr:unnamed protein product [Arctia plantaginis]
MVQSHIYILQVLFAIGITLGSQCLDFESKHTWVASIARYVVYILTVQGSKATSVLVYEILHGKRDWNTHLFSKVNRNRFIIYFVAAAIVYLNNNKLYAEDLPLVLIAYLIVKYPEMDTDQEWLLISVKIESKVYDHILSDSDQMAGKSEIVPVIDIFAKTTVFKALEGDQKMLASQVDTRQVKEHVLWDRKNEARSQREKSACRRSNQQVCRAEGLAPCQKHQGTSAVSLGAGLACSYIEGYLVYVIPTDGRDIKGLQDNIRTFEDTHNVVFPVKRLFVIVTKSMHCPTDLKEFNDKSDREDVNRLEACLSFEKVVRDVAGVKNRHYKNSAYKIIRPNNKPVYIAAECATSLHTLYKVMKNRHLCDEMVGVNVGDIVSDFVCTLRSALDSLPELKNKCEVVYFDDTDETLNLSDVLLDRVKTLEPNFEEYIRRRR